jgi:ribonuclease T2
MILSMLLAADAWSGPCADAADTFSAYDEVVPADEIADVETDYYVLVYSWTPGYCAGVDSEDRQPGGADYLQCGAGQDFGYIVHGLWPQGARSGRGGYPRACEGDQPRIQEEVLDEYLCMTPSRKLLQHEFEFHGTCMHDESLETPRAYFDTAFRLHQQMTLPGHRLDYRDASVDWLVRNNPHLQPENISYRHGADEWMFCFDTEFAPLSCPERITPRGNENEAADEDCPVKGNISNRSGAKYYFVPSHPNYDGVVISRSKGERCFETERQAERAGWSRAPGS